MIPSGEETMASEGLVAQMFISVEEDTTKTNSKHSRLLSIMSTLGTYTLFCNGNIEGGRHL
jgi:hypothetical protein